MEIVFAAIVSLTAVIVTLLSVVTARQQREIADLWKQVGDLNEVIISHSTQTIQTAEAIADAFDAQNEINSMLIRGFKRG